jgi:uncharacterized repeat protein (TIGR03803 family)
MSGLVGSCRVSPVAFVAAYVKVKQAAFGLLLYLHPRVPQMKSLLASFCLLFASLGMIGCGIGPSFTSQNAAWSSRGLTGNVHGGQQPVTGAKIYLYEVSTSATAGAATSLLTAPGYVTSDTSGDFTITGDYTCPAGAYVYLLATGGNPGLAANTNNAELTLGAALGPCSSLTASSFFTINEVTTVAAAYSFSAIATSETQVGSASTSAIVSAFGNITNLIDPRSGTALTVTPAGGGIVPQAEINSLANVLAACVNSDGTGTPCAALMSAANVSSIGGKPVDTFQAALNIAQNPGTNVAAIYKIADPASPFQPTLSQAPSDWSIVIQYPPPVTVTLSPASATLGQTAQQTFTASVSGAMPGSYKWTTTATAGLLNEVGGAGQTGQTSYCSTSGQTTYVPNATPALTANASDTVTAQAFSGAGCVAGNSLGANSANVTIVLPLPNTTLPGFPTIPQTQTIVLPSGSTLRPDQLTVVDSVTQITPSASGTFTLARFDDGEQLDIVLSPSGTPMMMSWMDAAHPTISASTTAEVLAFFALGGMQMLNESDRNQMIAQIPQLSGFPALAQTVATELGNNPDAFAQPDANLTNALNALFMGISGITPRVARPGTVVKPQDVIGSPGNSAIQSGVSLISQNPFSAYMTNAYRRRTHAFVIKQKDTLNGQDTASGAAVTDFDIGATVGLTGGVTGAVTDIFKAYFGTQPTAYAPVDTDPFNVPLTAGFDKTTYQVINLGAGGSGAPSPIVLTPGQHTVLVTTAVNGFVNDALVPFVSNVCFGSGFMADSSNTTLGGVANFRSAFVLNLETQVLALTGSISGEQDKIVAGDYKGAMKDLLFGVGVQQFQSAVGASIVAAVNSSGYNPASLNTALGKFNVVMNAAGGALQVFDTGVYTAQILSSDNVDLWTVESLPTAAKLTPPTTVLHGLGSVGLTVTVPSVGNTSGYSLHWTVTPTTGQPLIGNLTEVGGAGRTDQTDFCSSSPDVSYVNNAAAVQALTQLGTDTVSVTVFSASNCNSAKALTKTVTATVSTDPNPGLNVTPVNSIIDLGGTVALTATYSDPNTTPTTYMWVLQPQNASDGTLTGQGSNGTNSYCSTSNQATFTSTAPAPLAASVTDTVQVTAFNATGCSSGTQLGNPNSAFITTSNTPHLRLTPTNKTIAPNHQVSLIAAFRLGLPNPPTPGSYLWTTTGIYGTLTEVGGNGRTGQTNYCSTSAQATYVSAPNANLTQPVMDMVTATPFANANCTGNPDGLTATTTVTIDPAITTISPTSVDTYTGLLLASDGNFYAVSSFGNTFSSSGTCSGGVPDAAYSQCTYLHKIAPDGTDTQLHLFQNDNLNYTTTNADGFSPNPLVEAGDGNFYGTTVTKGPNATGTIFQITPSGTFTVLYAFPDRQAGQSYAVNPYQPGPLTLGQDGFLYGTSTGVYQDPNAISDGPPASFTFFKIGTDGTYTLLHPLDGTSGGFPTPLVQGDDGNFYTVAIQTNPPNNVQLLKISPAGAVTIMHAFAADGSEGFPANGALVEGPDHTFYYGSTTTNVFPAGASYQERDGLFKISPTGVVQALHTFAASEGISTNGDLLFDGAGNLYGSSYYGGNTGNCPAGTDVTYTHGTSPAGCGSVFQLTPGGVLNSVYQFTNTARDGANPSGRLVQTAEGTLAGTFYKPSTFTTNGIFELTPPLPPLIQLSFTDPAIRSVVTTVFANTPLTLNWQVLNAFSMTAQQCYAFIQGSPTGTGVWTGKQTGVSDSTGYYGSAAITPTVAGNYTYALTCGGTESAFATLVIQ